MLFYRGLAFEVGGKLGYRYFSSTRRRYSGPDETDLEIESTKAPKDNDDDEDIWIGKVYPIPSSPPLSSDRRSDQSGLIGPIHTCSRAMSRHSSMICFRSDTSF